MVSRPFPTGFDVADHAPTSIRELVSHVSTIGRAVVYTTAAGKLLFGIFASLAEFERELVSERTCAGHAAARARGCTGGRRPKMTPAKIRLAAAAMWKRGTVVGDLCKELGISRATLYRHVSPTGTLREDGKKIIGH